MGMLADSGLLNDLHAFANSPLRNLYCIYGDPANPYWVHLQAHFRNGALTPQMLDVNTLTCLYGNQTSSFFQLGPLFFRRLLFLITFFNNFVSNFVTLGLGIMNNV